MTEGSLVREAVVSLQESRPGGARASRAVLAVATNVVRQALRNKVFYFLVFFGLALVGLTSLTAELTIGVVDRVLRDTGTAAVDFIAVLLTTYLGVSEISREVDQRTILGILGTQRGRGLYFLGKFLGLIAVLSLCLGAMYLVLAAFLGAFSYDPVPWNAINGYFVLRLASVVMLLSIAVFFSVTTSNTVAAFSTLAIFVVGSVSPELQWLIDRANPGPGKWVLEAAYFVIPHFNRFDLSHEVAYGAPVHTVVLLKGVAYGLLYGAAMVLFGSLAFRRRDLA
jgi:ABC-type transport system involved in multi-copper enzyme maturation permease subunit